LKNGAINYIVKKNPFLKQLRRKCLSILETREEEELRLAKPEEELRRVRLLIFSLLAVFVMLQAYGWSIQIGWMPLP